MKCSECKAECEKLEESLRKEARWMMLEVRK